MPPDSLSPLSAEALKDPGLIAVHGKHLLFLHMKAFKRGQQGRDPGHVVMANGGAFGQLKNPKGSVLFLEFFVPVDIPFIPLQGIVA